MLVLCLCVCLLQLSLASVSQDELTFLVPSEATEYSELETEASFDDNGEYELRSDQCPNGNLEELDDFKWLTAANTYSPGNFFDYVKNRPQFPEKLKSAWDGVVKYGFTSWLDWGKRSGSQGLLGSCTTGHIALGNDRMYWMLAVAAPTGSFSVCVFIDACLMKVGGVKLPGAIMITLSGSLTSPFKLPTVPPTVITGFGISDGSGGLNETLTDMWDASTDSLGTVSYLPHLWFRVSLASPEELLGGMKKYIALVGEAGLAVRIPNPKDFANWPPSLDALRAVQLETSVSGQLYFLLNLAGNAPGKTASNSAIAKHMAQSMGNTFFSNTMIYLKAGEANFYTKISGDDVLIQARLSKGQIDLPGWLNTVLQLPVTVRTDQYLYLSLKTQTAGVRFTAKLGPLSGTIQIVGAKLFSSPSITLKGIFNMSDLTQPIDDIFNNVFKGINSLGNALDSSEKTVKNELTKAQSKVTEAQGKVTSASNDLSSAQKKFDDAIDYLEKKKDDAEKACKKKCDKICKKKYKKRGLLVKRGLCSWAEKKCSKACSGIANAGIDLAQGAVSASRKTLDAAKDILSAANKVLNAAKSTLSGVQDAYSDITDALTKIGKYRIDLPTVQASAAGSASVYINSDNAGVSVSASADYKAGSKSGKWQFTFGVKTSLESLAQQLFKVLTPGVDEAKKVLNEVTNTWNTIQRALKILNIKVSKKKKF